jgi:hypothetical protein
MELVEYGNFREKDRGFFDEVGAKERTLRHLPEGLIFLPFDYDIH